jgi:hypothetical protein
MEATAGRSPDEQIASVVERAAAEGFQLVHFETPHGQLVWEWRRGDEPRPQFVSRRVALDYMDDRLRRNAVTRHRLPLRRHASRRRGTGS